MKEKILILVKTYPIYSRTYFELVCTAGINEQGQWKRIYPVPFRELEELEKYKKYQWVEVELVENSKDPRPESYKVQPGSTIEVLGEPLPTANNWEVRKNALANTLVYTSLEEIIAQSKENRLSLCQFQPKEISDLKVEDTEREWNENILNHIATTNAQGVLFQEMAKEIKLVNKLPYESHRKKYLGRPVTATATEADENIQKLIALEDPNEPTKIIIHVNKLKEGWDVTNLYTTIPLRASASEILTEQTIGHGLRCSSDCRMDL